MHYIKINIAVNAKRIAIKTSNIFLIFSFEINILIDDPKPAHVITEKKQIRGADKETNKVALTNPS